MIHSLSFLFLFICLLHHLYTFYFCAIPSVGLWIFTRHDDDCRETPQRSHKKPEVEKRNGWLVRRIFKNEMEQLKWRREWEEFLCENMKSCDEATNTKWRNIAWRCVNVNHTRPLESQSTVASSSVKSVRLPTNPRTSPEARLRGWRLRVRLWRFRLQPRFGSAGGLDVHVRAFQQREIYGCRVRGVFLTWVCMKGDFIRNRRTRECYLIWMPSVNWAIGSIHHIRVFDSLYPQSIHHMFDCWHFCRKERE